MIFFGILKCGKTELEINGKRNLSFFWYFEMWENWKSTEKENYDFFIILKCGKTELEIHLWNGVQQMKKPTTTATERYYGHYFRYFYNDVQL